MWVYKGNHVEVVVIGCRIRVLYICVQAQTRNGVLTVALLDECSLSHYAMSAHCRSAGSVALGGQGGRGWKGW